MEKFLIEQIVYIFKLAFSLLFIYHLLKLIITKWTDYKQFESKQAHEKEMLKKNLKRQETEYKQQKVMKKLDYEHKLAETILKNQN